MITGAVRTASSTGEYFKDLKGLKKYYAEMTGEWQGKLGIERFPEIKIQYEDFVKVVDENDRFSNFQVKFSVSGRLSEELKGSRKLNMILKDAGAKVVEKIQEENKVKFRKEKHSKKPAVTITKNRNKNSELVAKINSHNVAKKNVALVEASLGNAKYRSMFREEMVNNLKKIGITSSPEDFDFKPSVHGCSVCLDLVSQAPKSVSLTMMFDEHYWKILRCHEKANEAAIKFIEENYLFTRVKERGIKRRVLSHNMLSARFLDFYNRALQPHLHSHNVIFNTTRNPFFDKSKKWSKEFNTVDFRTIRDNYEIIDGVYKGELINRLKKEGYRLEHDKNNRLNFEIAGFTREQILHFSRVPQIDKKLEEMGTDRKHANAKQRDTANLMTRAEKVLVELDSWRAQFREKMSAMGIKSPTLIQEIELSPQGLPANIPAADLEKTLSQAAGDFLYAHAAFTKREFINGVLKKAGDVLSPRYVEDYFDGSGLFINLGERTGKTYFSTRKNINLEKSLYRYVAADIKRKKGLIKESKVNRFLKHSCLLEGQKSAVRLMAHCPGRVVAIQGDPGVGKSFLLDEARMLFEKEGFFVRGLAPSNQAALTLRKESGLRASTLHAFFVKLQADAGNWKKGYDAFDLRLTNFKGLKRSTQREVWFVDEASMIDNYTMKRLFEAAQIKRAYVILVGDKNQMPPIESGKPFANMINKNLISFVEVKKILRQKETWYVLDSGELSKRHKSRIKKQARYQNAKVIFSDTLPSGSIKAGQLETLRVKRGVEVKVFKDCSLKDAVSQMVNGDIAAGLETLKDRIYEIRNDEERLQKIAETYAGFSPEERAQTIAVTGGNRDRVKVNDYVRSALKRRGELTGGRFVEVKLHGKSEVREFAPGDRVIFLKKKQVSGFWVIKNDTGIVVKVKTKKRLGLKTSGLYMRDKHFITIISRGRRIVVDSERYNQLEHYYCSTTYKEQSSSHDRVLAHIDTKQYRLNSKNDIIVKTSRAREEVIFFTDNRKSLYDWVKREHEKISIGDFSEADFKTHLVDRGKEGKAELLEKIADRFEYENAAFSKADFVIGTLAIHEEMLELEETLLEVEGLEMRDCFEQKVKAGDFIEVGELKGATYFSTEQNIRIENGIYEKAAVVKKQENYVPGFAYTKVNKYLDRSTLTTGQKEAVLFMTGSRCRVRAVQAAPGTGVPFMLNFARDFYEQEGDYKVVALTPTKKAADNLKEKAGIEDAATLHSYFIQLQKETGTWEAGGDPLDLRKANFAGLTPGSNREIWFVDKAGLVDNVAMNKLMEASALKKAEVVLIGDTKQFQPVGAGRPFANMIGNGKIGYIELDEIVRQTEVWQVFDSAKLSPAQRDKILQQASQNNAVVSFFKSRPCDFIDAGQLENIQVQPGIDVEVFKDSSLKQAIESVLDRDIAAGLETLKSRIQEIRDDDLRLEKIAGTYTSLSPAERKQTHVITGTNRDRVRINDFIRQNLKTMGEIGAGEVFDVRDSRGKKQQREFAPGDKIIFLENYDKISGHDVTKGDTGTVRKIEIKEKENNPPDRFIVVETKGKSVVIDPAEYNYLDHSQCSTSYKVMSAGDKKRALAHFDSKQYNVNNSNDLLVKLSAAGQEITIFCDDAKSLYDSVKREQDKVSINDFPPENFKKHQEPELSKEEAEKAARYKLLAKVAGKFEYKNAAFTKADFVFGSMDVYSDLRREDEAAAEISAGDLAAYFKEKVDSGEFLEVGSIGEDAYFATEENINVENGIYEKAASAKDNITGFEENKVRRYAENTTLTTGQKDVLVFTATSKDRVRAIQGNPGVGKSFMLNIAKNFYEDENYKVIALAPSNKAVTNLKERAGFEDAATIHAYLMKLQKQSSTWATGRDARDLRFANLNEITPGNYKEVWFVDEASLIDNHAMDGLLEAAEKKNAEMVLIGDKNQLQPVGAGKPFSVLLKEGRIQHSELKDILRQKAHWTVYDAGKLSKTDKEEIVKQAKLLENNAAVTFVKTGAAIDTTEEQNPVTYRVETYKTGAGMEVEIHKDSALKEAVKDAVDHNIAASLNKLGSRVTGIENNIERFRVIASRYAELPAQVRNEAVIITATNRDRTAINDFVRKHLKEKGELGKGSNFVVTDIVGKKHVREFAPGDKVIFLKKGVFDNHFISKDDVGFVKEISGKNITFSIQEKDVVISMDRYDHIDHAHCRTTYRVQGADYSIVFANIDTRQSMINSRNDFLVKISRAIHKLEIFTDDRYKLYDAVNREQFKVCINDFKDEFYRKAERHIISQMLKGMAKRDFENDPLPKKVIEDLHRADANYIKYLQLKGVAGDELSKAGSLFKSRFSSMKAQRGAEEGASNYIDIEKRAAAYESKSKRYYRRAMVKYTAILSRQEVLLEGEKIDRAQLQERFERTYVPGGSLATLGDFAAGKGVNPEEAIENCFSDLEMPHNSPGLEVGGAGQEQDVPGLDGPVEDGGIVPGVDGGEGRDGGGSGPGISFGT